MGKRRIQDQGVLPHKTPVAPRRRNAVSIDAGATETAPLATMLGGGSTAEQSLDRHTIALAQCVLMFLLSFFHAMSVAAAQVCVCLGVCMRERDAQLFNVLFFPSSPPHSLRCGHDSYVVRSPYFRYASCLTFILNRFYLFPPLIQVWPQQSYVTAVFSACMMLNFGMSHTINGLSKRQNLALVLYANLLLLPTLHKIIKNELVLSADHVMVLLGVCVYIHTYIHTYVYTYIHTYIALWHWLMFGIGLVCAIACFS